MRIAICLFASAVLSSAAALADANAETAAALKEAYRAAEAPTLAEVHAHLHQVVNCLVGPKDSLFDASQPNPCAKLGKGALIDTKDETARNHLHDAVDLAGMGIASSDFDKAIMLATGAAGALRESQRPNAKR